MPLRDGDFIAVGLHFFEISLCLPDKLFDISAFAHVEHEVAGFGRCVCCTHSEAGFGEAGEVVHPGRGAEAEVDEDVERLFHKVPGVLRLGDVVPADVFSVEAVKGEVAVVGLVVHEGQQFDAFSLFFKAFGESQYGFALI